MLNIAKGSIPLYMQIKELLIAKVSAGEWLPGDLIPSEMQLAQELGVSPGTVRNAVTELVESNVLMRRQGRGTFVANHNSDRALFYFFHITDNKGHKLLPESQILQCRRKSASRLEATKLQLEPGAMIIKIERVRSLSNKPTILETIALPADSFEDLANDGNCNLPNTLYELYEKQYGITIHSADEQLRAVAATKHEASLLKLEAGSPLLEIERIALRLDKTPVELRISRCSTKNHHYQNTIF
ncbi:MAG: GntR family transcriptional regulator [Gammaproteobacteria bacterium]|nr:GntR family transcriptional regulator [Gammaproteobacteria bacterium]